MVTAGIYLILRLSTILNYQVGLLKIIMLIGACTAIFGAILASRQFDIKRIIAYSTCSQLGYMFLACGLGAFSSGFFHLLLHGFFKALLFLCAGVVIHSQNGEQDIRRMGKMLFSQIPVTIFGFLVGSSALVGIPFLAGFYSKEQILFLVLIYKSNSVIFSYYAACFALFFTAFYSTRLFFNLIVKNTTNLNIYENYKKTYLWWNFT
jgi:NADH-quinone oxidoreductase subunit L